MKIINFHDNNTFEIVKQLVISEGILCTEESSVKFTQGDTIRAIVKLSKPVIVSIASEIEPDGFYQFPRIGRSIDGTLIVSWQMKEDSYKTYGVDSDGLSGIMMSKDEGQTWMPLDKSYFAPSDYYRMERQNGDIINIETPIPKKISTYKNFPNAVGQINNFLFYRESELPEDLSGIYLKIWKREKKQEEIIHARLHDPEYLRYSIDGLMPIVWWGDIKEMSNSDLVSGIYPSYSMDERGDILPPGVKFYKSSNDGKDWYKLGEIKYEVDLKNDPDGKYRSYYYGFQEPAFEILKDSTFLCVMRTSSNTPMYKSVSKDRGYTWSKPQAFAPNGVLPRLLLLDNGVLILVSGRPGLQLRFSLDGKGETWTDPIDFIPFMKNDGTYDMEVSCGYASLLKVNRNTFYMVYSDFKTKVENGDMRKSIKFRKVSINLL